MIIAVFGATGTAGSAVTSEALSRGHHVIAVSRTPGRDSAQLSWRSIDLDAGEKLEPILAHTDVAVLTVRPDPGQEHRIVQWTSTFLDAAAATETRVIVIGGAAALRTPGSTQTLVADDPAYVAPQWASVARASLEQFRACVRHSSSRWTYLSPPAILEPGPGAGTYRRGTTRLLTNADGVSQITAGDLSLAVLDEVESPQGDQHFTVCAADPP
ncbi:NAD(P)-dependent oxidoreductase [Ruania halotolerans]|uniref:NAD(P)-dependent oxidoreductase n=1 Tax=Ruania halotolerans TaxID=2897773 RepID=UPI001E289BFF|nr:NAD(P)H-binding protein [Ruania halotolerans]UFU05597.1 NAD(P)H-binding protein [Ruania halotolerans]